MCGKLQMRSAHEWQAANAQRSCVASRKCAALMNNQAAVVTHVQHSRATQAKQCN